MRDGRVVRVVAMLGVATVIVVSSVLMLVRSPWASAFGIGLWLVIGGGSLVAVLRGARRAGVRGVADAVRPGLQGLDEVQGIQLGRPEPAPRGFTAASGVQPTLSEDRPDPLAGYVDRRDPRV